MFRVLLALAFFVLASIHGLAASVDAAKLRADLEMQYSMTLGIGFRSSEVMTGKPIVSNPKAEIAALEKKLTGKPSDAPLHLRMAELYSMLDANQSDSSHEQQAGNEYEKAAAQYKTLLAKKPSDKDLLLGYGKALAELGVVERTEAGQVFRRIIKADPAAWEARIELAELLQGQAVVGLMAGRMQQGTEVPEELKNQAKLPKGLSKEEAEKLDREADEQRDLAVKYAPGKPQVYVSRFMGRFQTAILPLVSGLMYGGMPQMEPASMLAIARNILDTYDLRKAWELDPTSASTLRIFVLFEIASVLLDESANKPVGDLIKGILDENPDKRTWNIISADSKARLARYERDAERILKSKPKDAWAAYEGLGILKAFQGDRSEARMALENAVKLSGASTLSFILLLIDTSHGLDFGDFSEENAAKMVPLWELRIRASDSSSDLRNAATIFAQAGQLDKAESTVRRSLINDEESQYGHHLLGVIIIKRQGNIREAIRHLEKAVSLKGDEEFKQNAQYNLGVAYLLAGEPQKAAAELNKIPSESSVYKKAQELLK